MQDLLSEFVKNGIYIFPCGEKFVVNKVATSSNSALVSECRFDSYESAVEYASGLVVQMRDFIAIVRYNRGLGVEYKTLPIIRSANLEEARSLATQIIEKMFVGQDVTEVRVRPKF